jgi:hypothetical protein
MAELAADVQRWEPRVPISRRTLDRRRVDEDWDEWWLFDRMTFEAVRAYESRVELADQNAGWHQANAFFHATGWFQRAEIPDANGMYPLVYAGVDEYEVSVGRPPFPRALREPLQTDIPLPWLKGVDVATMTVRMTERIISSVELLRMSNGRQQLPADQVGETLRRLERSRGELPMARDDLARWLSRHETTTAGRTGTHGTQLRYWESRLRWSADDAREPSAVRLTILAWLVTHDDPDAGPRDEKSWHTLLKRANAVWCDTGNQTVTFRQEFRALLRRGWYLFGFDGLSLRDPLPANFSDPFADDGARRNAVALAGHVDRKLKEHGTNDARQAHTGKKGDLEIERATRSWLKWVDDYTTPLSMDIDETALAVIHAMHQLSIRAMTCGDVRSSLSRLAGHPSLLEPAHVRLPDPEEWFDQTGEPWGGPMSLTGLRSSIALAYQGGRLAPRQAANALVLPRNSAVVAAVHALGTPRTPRSSAAAGVGAGVEEDRWRDVYFEPQGSGTRVSPREMDMRLRSLIMRDPLGTLIDAPGLVAAYLTADDGRWHVREAEPEVYWIGSDHAGDVTRLWTLMETLDYRAFTPRVQRDLTQLAVCQRSAALLSTKPPTTSVGTRTVNRVISAINALTQEMGAGLELTASQRDRLNSVLQSMPTHDERPSIPVVPPMTWSDSVYGHLGSTRPRGY